MRARYPIHAFMNKYILLTYSIYFSYTIFLTDYKKILKIAGGVKQLTVPLLPDPNCSMTRTMRSASFLSSAPVPFKMLYCFQTNVVPQFF